MRPVFLGLFIGCSTGLGGKNRLFFESIMSFSLDLLAGLCYDGRLFYNSGGKRLGLALKQRGLVFNTNSKKGWNNEMAKDKHTTTDGDAALAARANGETPSTEKKDAIATVSSDASLAGLDPALQALIPKNFVETDIGFPPYWKADVNKGFRGIILGFDDRDPDFVRIHIENTGPALDCQRGPVDDGVVSTVQPGRIFTIGKFGALPLEGFIGVEVVALCVGKRKLPGNEASRNVPRDLYEWRMLVAKEVEELMKGRRQKERDQLRKLQEEARGKMLAEIASIQAKKLAENSGGVINTVGVAS